MITLDLLHFSDKGTRYLRNDQVSNIWGVCKFLQKCNFMHICIDRSHHRQNTKFVDLRYESEICSTMRASSNQSIIFWCSSQTIPGRGLSSWLTGSVLLWLRVQFENGVTDRKVKHPVGGSSSIHSFLLIFTES
jgi:hypothetical protein